MAGQSSLPTGIWRFKADEDILVGFERVEPSLHAGPAFWFDCGGRDPYGHIVQVPAGCVPADAVKKGSHYKADPAWCLASPLRARPPPSEVTTPGQLQSLAFVPARADWEALQADEVELAMHASAVNFKDVAVSLGLLGSSFGATLGFEGLGTVPRLLAAPLLLVRPQGGSLAKNRRSARFSTLSSLALRRPYYWPPRLAQKVDWEPAAGRQRVARA